MTVYNDTVYFNATKLHDSGGNVLMNMKLSLKKKKKAHSQGASPICTYARRYNVPASVNFQNKTVSSQNKIRCRVDSKGAGFQ